MARTSELDRRRSWAWLGGIVGLGVLVDQVTKQIADATLRDRRTVTVIEGFLELRYARNPGAFFSMGAELEPMIRRGVFIVASLVASALMLSLYRKAAEGGHRLQQAALGLLLGGALGNLIDRVLYGEVIDFVHMFWRGVFDWATYNVADVQLVAGVALLAVDLLRRGDAENGAGEPTPSEADA